MTFYSIVDYVSMLINGLQSFLAPRAISLGQDSLSTIIQLSLAMGLANGRAFWKKRCWIWLSLTTRVLHYKNNGLLVVLFMGKIVDWNRLGQLKSRMTAARVIAVT